MSDPRVSSLEFLFSAMQRLSVQWLLPVFLRPGMWGVPHSSLLFPTYIVCRLVRMVILDWRDLISCCFD